jgi:hypothetical protein
LISEYLRRNGRDAIATFQNLRKFILRGNNMTTLTNNLNEQLFTELTPEESAVIGGGVLVKGAIHFDNLQTTVLFKNNRGTKIQVNTNTRAIGKANPDNTHWTLSLQQLIGGRYRTVSSRFLPFNGSFRSLFAGLLVPGGIYRLRFSDENDGKRVKGTYAVYD